MTKEELINQIIAESLADGEPVTRQEAEEMAEMEIRAKANRHYEQADKPKKERKAPVRKEDTDKRELMQVLLTALQTAELSPTLVNIEKCINFSYKGAEYSVNLTKHRPPK